MHDFIFRFPADCPRLDFETLAELLRTRWYPMASGEHYAKIGTTVRVRWHGGAERSATAALPPAVNFELYDLRIARIMPGAVYFPGPDDPHVTTTEWIARIIRDNRIGNGAGRVRRHKGDGEGPPIPRGGRAGLLTVDWDRNRPVFGHAYPARTRQEAS
jgi:hypothetical protein